MGKKVTTTLIECAKCEWHHPESMFSQAQLNQRTTNERKICMDCEVKIKQDRKSQNNNKKRLTSSSSTKQQQLSSSSDKKTEKHKDCKDEKSDNHHQCAKALDKQKTTTTTTPTFEQSDYLELKTQLEKLQHANKELRGVIKQLIDLNMKISRGG